MRKRKCNAISICQCSTENHSFHAFPLGGGAEMNLWPFVSCALYDRGRPGNHGRVRRYYHPSSFPRPRPSPPVSLRRKSSPTLRPSPPDEPCPPGQNATNTYNSMLWPSSDKSMKDARGIASARCFVSWGETFDIFEIWTKLEWWWRCYWWRSQCGLSVVNNDMLCTAFLDVWMFMSVWKRRKGEKKGTFVGQQRMCFLLLLL